MIAHITVGSERAHARDVSDGVGVPPSGQHGTRRTAADGTRPNDSGFPKVFWTFS